MLRLLRPGGLLLLVTPDVGCWQARLLGPRWVHYHVDHLGTSTAGRSRNSLSTPGFRCWCVGGRGRSLRSSTFAASWLPIDIASGAGSHASCVAYYPNRCWISGSRQLARDCCCSPDERDSKQRGRPTATRYERVRYEHDGEM
jgi:hypothetical protein